MLFSKSHAGCARIQHAFSETTRLTELYMNRFKQLLATKGIDYDSYSDPVLYEVDEARFCLRTERARCGDTDYDTTWFPMSDLDIDAAELNRRVAERAEQERIECERKAAEEKRRRQAVQDYEDKKTYERLKQKFGDA